MNTDIKKLISENVSIKKIEALLMVNDDLDNSAIKKLLKPYRNTTKRNNMQLIVEHIINNKDKMSRRNLAIDCENKDLCKESTAFHYLSLLNFCEEYHKQMSSK